MVLLIQFQCSKFSLYTKKISPKAHELIKIPRMRIDCMLPSNAHKKSLAAIFQVFSLATPMTSLISVKLRKFVAQESSGATLK